MTRRFFLVVIEPEDGWVEDEDAELSGDLLKDLIEVSWRYSATVIPVDRGQAASCALGSGVPVSDIIGIPTESYTGSHEPDGPCRVTTHVRVDGVCVRCGDKQAVPGVYGQPRGTPTEHEKWREWAARYEEDDDGGEYGFFSR